MKTLFADPPAMGRYESNHGELTIVEVYMSKDMPCRKVKSHVVYKKIGALPHDIMLAACQLPTGQWKLAS
jgi:hypothetical protein